LICTKPLRHPVLGAQRLRGSASIQCRACRDEYIRLDPQPGFSVFLCFHQKQPGGGIRPVLHKGQPLGLQPVGPQDRQHLGQPLGPVAEREPSAILQQPERAFADIIQRAVRLVAGSGPGPVGGLLPCREIGRVAGAQVVAACALPEGAQVGADGRDVLNALFGAGSGQQRAGFGLQFQPQAGAGGPGRAIPGSRCRSRSTGRRRARPALAPKTGPAAARLSQSGARLNNRLLFYYTKSRWNVPYTAPKIHCQNIGRKNRGKLCMKEKQQTRF